MADLDVGMAVGLIKALGSPDPTVIEGAVADWLDEHPEATTTVEDGAISYSKLDSSLKETVDDVADLKSDFNQIREPYGNLVYSSTWNDVNATHAFVGDTVVATAKSSGTYRATFFYIDVTNHNKLTVSWKSKAPTSPSTAAAIRWGFTPEIGSGTETWKAYLSSSPSVLDVTDTDYVKIGLYVDQASVSQGATATFTELQVEYGETATPFNKGYTAIDSFARDEINEIKYVVPTVDISNRTLANTALWEAGTISDTTGKNTANSKSVRLKDYVKVDPTKPLYYQAYYELPDSRETIAGTDNAHMKNPYLYEYTKDLEFIRRVSPTVAMVIGGNKFTVSNNCNYVRFAFYTDLSNSSIATIMPSTIYIDEVDGDLWLPPYYDSYIDSKAETIEHYLRNEEYNSTSQEWEKVYDPDAKLVSFVFVTDEHAPQYNQMRSPAIINRLAEKLNIQMVVSGGDVDQSGLLTYQYCGLLRKAFNKEIHHAVGNHEFLSKNTGTSLYYDMDELNSNQVGDADHHYYYVDNPQYKIRFIVLAANMESETAMGTGTGTAAQIGYTQEQIDWVNDIALATLPTGWEIIVFTHFFYTNGTGTAVSLSHGSSIVSTLANNPAVIAVFQGHTHFDRIVKGHDVAAGSLPFIITSCDKNIPHSSESTYPVNRATGTIYEQLFDVVVINRSTKTINLIRIGGLAMDGVNDSEGVAAEIRTVTYGT